ncbi:hypothetical protein [Nostoc sp. PCC 7524]|uniref:hypothetical protein n=1 Tax=Nostoc sp. (strain ATCC 29411 / PCC 7524) TaxID=28072 RepID=UPI001493FFD9|nr:hypothetical protein [Nostoc sp. PCC 7524]
MITVISLPISDRHLGETGVPRAKPETGFLLGSPRHIGFLHEKPGFLSPRD